MSEIRLDPLSRRHVIIGGERAGRPNEFVEAATRSRELPCPFCLGHESETPPAIAIYGEQKANNWLVRVVPNKFPAVTLDANGSATAAPEAGEACQPGFGAHEVIIESPEHVASLSELTDLEVLTVFSAYQDRIQAFAKDRRIR
jgi:UDPglucose--hexose-1-phosphate uridylyltransferase